MRTGRWSIAIVLALALTGTACSNSGSSAGSGGGLYGGGGSATAAPSATSSGSGGGGGGGYGHGGYGGGGGGGGEESSGGGPSALTVSQGNYLFSPTTPKVASGDTITIKNGTPETPHTFTVEGEEIDVTVDPASSQDVVIDLPRGTYPFFCRFHQAMGMTGTLTVR
jgi:plastocyanin